MAASPFPGMDPYIEDHAFWEGFHHVLIVECMFQLEQDLPDDYVSNVRVRTENISVDDPAAKVYVPGAWPRVMLTGKSRPDAALAVDVEPIPSVDSIEVREAYIEVLRVPGYELVTVLELMSPWNKHGEGVGIHQGKRAALVRDGVHLVELDLLRGGTRTHLSRPLPPGDYYANVFRGDRKPDVDVFTWRLRDKVPKIPIPLRAPDKDVALNLGEALRTAYERGRYDRKLRYERPLDPPLTGADAEWAQSLSKSMAR